jgi:beta-galactosidase
MKKAANAGVSSYNADSFLINGDGFFIHSGELHYFRIPRDLWQDRLLKAKRCFLNTVTTYIAWNWHEPLEGRFRFDGDADLDYYFKVCEELGLYVIARPGPYICSEWDSGGFPNWVCGKKCITRSREPVFMDLTSRYYDSVCPVIRRHLITRGGSVILFQVENEYFWGNVQYIEDLSKLAEDRGIDVPIVHNVNRFLRGTRIIDCLDYYPAPWQISDIEKQIDQLRVGQPDKPMMAMEFQGGWLSSFGGTLPTSRGSFPSPWTDVLLKTSIAKGLNAINYYMFHGGTNFGYWAGKGITTSYDYEAAVREWGELHDRYWVIRLVGAFLETFGRTLVRAKPVKDLVTPSTPGVDTFARSVDETSFVFVRNMADKDWTGKLKVGSLIFPAEGNLLVPSRSMVSLPVRVTLPDNRTILVYSTSEIFSTYTARGRTVIILYGKKGCKGETVFLLCRKPTVIGDVKSSWNSASKTLRLNYVHNAEDQLFLINGENQMLVAVLETERAARTWFAELQGVRVAMVSDLYFLRYIKEEGRRLTLSVEALPNKESQISVILPYKLGKVLVDGKECPFRFDKQLGVALFSLRSAPPHSLRKELSGNWKMKFESPEKERDFDDSRWLHLEHIDALEKHGFYKNGYVWYRTSLTLGKEDMDKQLILGKISDYASVYVNGKLVAFGRTMIKAKIKDFLKLGEKGVLAICVESTGHCNDGLIPVLNGLEEPVYLSEDKTVPAKWFYKEGTTFEEQIKPADPASIDFARTLNDPPSFTEASPEADLSEWTELTREKSLTVQPQKPCWIRCTVDLPPKARNSRVAVEFNQAGAAWGMMTFFANGNFVKTCQRSDAPFSVDVTRFVKGRKLTVAIVFMGGYGLKVFEGSTRIVIYDKEIVGPWAVKEGLHGEEAGWGGDFNDADWATTNVPSSWRIAKKDFDGVAWYRKRFRFEPQKKYVAPVKLVLEGVSSKCQIYLNGFLVGRYMDVGPQKEFYLPEPLLKEENILAIAVESCGKEGGITGRVFIDSYYAVEKLNVSFEF